MVSSTVKQSHSILYLYKSEDLIVCTTHYENKTLYIYQSFQQNNHMKLCDFIPDRKLQSPSKNASPNPAGRINVEQATRLYFNRLLDHPSSTTHTALTVAEGCCMTHKAHQAQDVAEQYTTTNKQLQQQLQRAKLVHSHLYSQLLHHLRERPDIHTVSLRVLCVLKNKQQE